MEFLKMAVTFKGKPSSIVLRIGLGSKKGKIQYKESVLSG
jgi:hypothetical protein